MRVQERVSIEGEGVIVIGDQQQEGNQALDHLRAAAGGLGLPVLGALTSGSGSGRAEARSV